MYSEDSIDDKLPLTEFENILHQLVSNEEWIEKVRIENDFINFYTSIPSITHIQSKPTKSPRTLKPHKFELLLTEPESDESIFSLYQLYEKETFHHDTTMKDFMGFLGGGFIMDEEEGHTGTVWLKWVIDDKCVAVSVLDVYPHVLV